LPLERHGRSEGGRLPPPAAYARIRRQFNMPVGRFEGVEQVIARMAGHTYIMDAARSVTAAAIDAGRAARRLPAGILQVSRDRKWAAASPTDAMDVHGGKGIMLGRRAIYLSGRGYQSIPIRDHGGRREHPDAQPDHLRPGRRSAAIPLLCCAKCARRATRSARAVSMSLIVRCSVTSVSRSRTGGALAGDGTDFFARFENVPDSGPARAITSTSSASAPPFAFATERGPC